MEWNFAPGDEIVPGRRATQLLGGGERYEAYLAWSELLLTPTVVKILRPDRVSDDRARHAIAAEGALLRELEHPSFMRVFDSDTDGARPFLELEYLDGPRLSTLLRRHGILLPEQLFALARQLAAALHYLHALRILHLDVKPRNVVMGPVPRLIDLSVARRFEDVPRVGGPVGTDAYMAPEQADPALYSTIGPATDVWGLGVTLYEASTKQLPFPRGNPRAEGAERWPQVGMHPSPAPAKVPGPVAELVMAAIDREPANRPSPLELFERFDDLASQHSVRRLRFN
ncbi:MAG TPA: serine/threonine-protein kinase [Candidatus Limnocylindria bacterium]|nr:serine/threonine-protein kinase [Candidatus Limnocylindria bacterium]